MKAKVSFDGWTDALRLKYDAINLKYDIKREYFTVGIPVFIAILLVLFAVMTGHTLTEQKKTQTQADDRQKAYEELLKQLGEEGGAPAAGTAGNSIPVPTSRADLDHYLIYSVLLAITPYSIDRYLQRREMKKNEEEFAQFLFKLSELMRAGIDPIKSVIELSKTDIGSIKKHVMLAASTLTLGGSFEEGMKKVSKSMKSELISKYIDLVIQASYMGGSVSNLILKASEDMRSMIMIEREMEGSLKQYVMIFYFAQLILIVLVYILSTQLFPFLTGAGIEKLFGGSIANIDYKQGFFHLLIINGLIGGIIIGKISEGSAKDGFKHSIILTLVSYLACVMIIFPAISAASVDTVSVKVISGDKQIANTGSELSPITFQVLDSQFNPLAGKTLNVTITPSGTVLNYNLVTDKNGKLPVRVMLGGKPGMYTITVTVDGATATVTARGTIDIGSIEGGD